MHRLCKSARWPVGFMALALAAAVALAATPAAAGGRHGHGWRGGDRHWGHQGHWRGDWRGDWRGGWPGAGLRGWAWRQDGWRGHDGLGWDFDRRWHRDRHDMRWVSPPPFRHAAPWPPVGSVQTWPWVRSAPPIWLHRPPAFHFGDPSFTVIVPPQ